MTPRVRRRRALPIAPIEVPSPAPVEGIVAARQAGRSALGAAAVAFGCSRTSYLTLPDVRPLATTNPSTTAFMELRAGEARATGQDAAPQSSAGCRTARSRPSLKRAVLVAEDAAFWQHDGVDFDAAAEVDRGRLGARARSSRGASTITQQLAKNLYLSPSTNPLRKLRELIIARRLEAELQKARILELYLNVIEWGDGIYGVEAAARTLLRHVGGVARTATQSALLAGAIINPRVLNPAHPTPRLLRRQQLILRRMGACRRRPIADPLPQTAVRMPRRSRPTPEPADADAESVHRCSTAAQPTPRDTSTIVAHLQRSSHRDSSYVASRFTQGICTASERVVSARTIVSRLATRMINYTERLTLLMQDIVSRVPTLSFIDIARRARVRAVRAARTPTARSPPATA